MTTIEVIENKISSVKKYLKILVRYKKYSPNEIEENLDLRGAVERYLYLATQATIDLAEAFIAYRGLRKPTTLSDAFYILQEDNIISQELANKMVKMTGFRNAIAHGYENLNYAVVCDVLQNRLKDIEEFLAVVSKAY